MSTTATTTRHEVVVDLDIAEAHEALAAARHALARIQSEVQWNREHNRAIDAKLDARWEAASVEVDDAEAELEARSERYEGWSRFFIVRNPGGHIHSSMSCSTCFPTTDFGWLPELSGLDEAAAVAEWGGILCSICFPSAPVEWTEGVNKKEAAERELAAALKAIAKSPEGKKVKQARDLVWRKQYAIERHERAIERWEVDSDNGRDATDIPAFVARDAARANEELPKLRKQLANAEAKLAAANAALEEALS